MKDHAMCLRAAAIVAHERDDVRFAVAGRGVAGSDALRRLIADGALEHRVFLLPERGDAPRFLAALDVAVLSSYSEAFPNVVGEAMACGVPCVTTNVGDSASIVGDTGRIVPPRDPGRFAQAILDVLNFSGASRAALGHAARQRVVDIFSLSHVTGEYVSLYRELAGRQATATSTVCAG